MWFAVCIAAGGVFEGVGVLQHIEQGITVQADYRSEIHAEQSTLTFS